MKRPTRKQGAIIALAAGLAVPFEGLRQVAYYDPPGILTVCFGSTTNVEKGKVYSLEECHERLDADMLEAAAAVDRRFPDAPLHVAVAFTDAVYNLGPVIVNTSSSTAARHLKAGRWREACDQLPRWNKARIGGVLIPLPGLTRRRAAERDVCLTGMP